MKAHHFIQCGGQYRISPERRLCAVSYFRAPERGTNHEHDVFFVQIGRIGRGNCAVTVYIALHRAVGGIHDQSAKQSE